MSEKVQLQILKNLRMIVGLLVAVSNLSEEALAMVKKLDEENRAVIAEAEVA